MKKIAIIFLGGFLLTGCVAQRSATVNTIDTSVTTNIPDQAQNTMPDDFCQGSDGALYATNTPVAGFTVVAPTQQTAAGRSYDIPEWDLSFTIPTEYSEFAVFKDSNSTPFRLAIDDVLSPGCLPEGDGGVTTLSIGPVINNSDTNNKPYSTYESMVEDFQDPENQIGKRSFASDFFQFHEYTEDSFAQTRLLTDFFVHQNTLYSLSTLHCQESCEASPIMDAMVVNIHPL